MSFYSPKFDTQYVSRRDGIRLSFAGNTLVTNVLRDKLETTKHQPQRKEPDHITSTTVISIVVQTIKE